MRISTMLAIIGAATLASVAWIVDGIGTTPSSLLPSKGCPTALWDGTPIKRPTFENDSHSMAIEKGSDIKKINGSFYCSDTVWYLVCSDHICYVHSSSNPKGSPIGEGLGSKLILVPQYGVVAISIVEVSPSAPTREVVEGGRCWREQLDSGRCFEDERLDIAWCADGFDLVTTGSGKHVRVTCEQW